MDITHELVDLASYRKTEALVIYNMYAQDHDIYRDGKIVTADATIYRQMKAANSNDLVNKFGQVYAAGTPLLLHRRLADVIIDTTIDMHERYGQITVVMDGLRTYDSGLKMQETRPDLIASGLLAKAGTSAHNRALAVDSKLFTSPLSSPLPLAGGAGGGNLSAYSESGDRFPHPASPVNGGGEGRIFHLIEADEHGHLDDLDMTASNRFYHSPMSDAARANRLHRLQAWQRASIKNRLPIANLLSEFWDDRVPGSPADMWRVLACRALCIGVDSNPKTNPAIAQLRDDTKALTQPDSAQAAHTLLTTAWNTIFTQTQKQQLDSILGAGGGSPPPLAEFLFHEWLPTIHDDDLEKTWGFRQASPA